MSLHFAVGDVLDAQADAILVAVDGDHPRMIGSIGRRLAERIDDELEWARIVEAAQFPIPAGGARVASLEEVSEVPFRYAIFISTFNHHNQELYLDTAYENALVYARNWGIKTLATPLYQGGWRGTAERARRALEAAAARHPQVDVMLYELQPHRR